MNHRNRIDRRILETLQLDTHVPVTLLADRVGLSIPACYRRIRRLREIGVIVREVAIVSPKTLGWPLSMIVLITLEKGGNKDNRRAHAKVPERT